jgi:serine/threonine protein kinase
LRKRGPEAPEVKDPAQEWLKSSMSKKRERVFGISDFEMLKELGAGKYGKVFLVRERATNFVCALKVLEKSLIKSEEITEQLIRELKIQTFLNHVNIIKMYGFFDDASNIYLVMEVATGGQLFKQIKKHESMPEAKVAPIMRQICQALTELHSNRIIHRDIKP